MLVIFASPTSTYYMAYALELRCYFYTVGRGLGISTKPLPRKLLILCKEKDSRKNLMNPAL